MKYLTELQIQKKLKEEIELIPNFKELTREISEENNRLS